MKFIDDFVAYHKDFTGCPETFVRWSGIYALSCVAGWGHKLPMGNWNHYPNLWVLLCGDSSVKKSTALSTAQNLITEINPEILAAQQYSEPALIADVSMNPHRCFFYDEAESFLKMLGEKYNQQMRSTLMMLYAGKVISRRIQGREGRGEYHETKTFENGHELRPYICWGGASTPYQIGHHLNGSTTDLMSGFFPRIILVPQTEKGYTIPRPPPHDPAKFAALRERLAVLHAIKDREYHYSDAAGKIFDDWHLRITRRAEKADNLSIAFYLKMRDIFIHKISIIFAFERSSPIIEADDISQAINLLWPIEKGWKNIISKFTENEWDREIDRVERFVREQEHCSRQEIILAVRGIRSQKLTAILLGLKQDGKIEESSEQTAGRPKTIIRWIPA